MMGTEICKVETYNGTKGKYHDIRCNRELKRDYGLEIVRILSGHLKLITYPKGSEGVSF